MELLGTLWPSSAAEQKAIHTQSHKISFQDCWSVSVIHKLPDSTLTTLTVNLKLHINSSSNHVTLLA